jgi:ribosomal protein L1
MVENSKQGQRSPQKSYFPSTMVGHTRAEPGQIEQNIISFSRVVMKAHTQAFRGQGEDMLEDSNQDCDATGSPWQRRC